MTAAQIKRLQDEWYARAQADGTFTDIEAPSKMIQRTRKVTGARLAKVAQLEQDRAATERLRFGEPWERKAWDLHCEGVSARRIAAKLCVYRKLVDEAFARLHWQMEHDPRGGRPIDPESLRSQGMRKELLLTPGAALALDHLRSVLKAPDADIVRRAIVELARKTPMGEPSSRSVMYRSGKAA